jgi:hypothetical protein
MNGRQIWKKDDVTLFYVYYIVRSRLSEVRGGGGEVNAFYFIPFLSVVLLQVRFE